MVSIKVSKTLDRGSIPRAPAKSFERNLLLLWLIHEKARRH